MKIECATCDRRVSCGESLLSESHVNLHQLNDNWEEENKRGRNSRFQTKEKSKVKSADKKQDPEIIKLIEIGIIIDYHP